MRVPTPLILIVSFILSLNPCSAQKEATVNSCLSREDLVKMVHLPVKDDNDTALMSMLLEKGYIPGLNVTTRLDTINSIVLEYECHVYFERVGGLKKVPTIFVCASKNGLQNLLVINLFHKKECAIELSKDFEEYGYIYNDENESYEGNDGEGFQNAHYSATIMTEGNDVLLTFRKQEEIDNYVNEQVKQRTALVNKLMTQACHHAENTQFDKAYSILNSAIGIYMPLDEGIHDLHNKILYKHQELLFEKLRVAVNQNRDYTMGLILCDSLLVLASNRDSILRIRHAIDNLIEDRVQTYSFFHPDSYQQALDSIDKILNQEIRQYSLDKHQTITLKLNFLTSTENNSRGVIALNTHRNWLQSKNNERIRNQHLQSMLDSLVSSDIIQPVYEHGIVINTQEEINAEIEWWHQDVTIDEDTKLQNDLKGFIDSIESIYFHVQDPKKPGKTLTMLPYHREYTLRMTYKVYNDSTYTDVLLTDYSTSNLLSWTPSLIIPGLGTQLEGYSSSLISRALPFFFFGGLALTGYLLENNGKEKTPWDAGGNFWEHKNFGNILLYGGSAIAIGIYITDIIEGIQAAFKNRSRSKAIKDQLKTDGCIKIKMDDIHIQ